MPPRLANFIFFVETGFLHVGQAGLKLLTSADLPASASQSAGITGVSHYAWPEVLFPLCAVISNLQKSSINKNDTRAFMYLYIFYPHSPIADICYICITR